ncbi:MAG: tRNA pseudouridine(55) synthase TruB [Patescibacteria group bacterium]
MEKVDWKKLKGIVAIYKPKGPTSFDIIYKLRQITGIKKIGHAGTLDPLASGVLVIGIGREATRKLNEAVESEKEYLATVRFGAESTTDDMAGEKNIKKVSGKPTRKEVKKALEKFCGKIMQLPPNFSAIKIGGVRAYRMARRGEIPKLKKRPVEVREIKIIKYKWPDLKIKIVSGKGFYVRSLARDLGKKLKVGGYLAALERTRVGRFKKSDAIKI